jgi:hypothetical protein
MTGPKMRSAPYEMEVLFYFCYIIFLPSQMVEVAEPPQPYFRPLDPRLGSSLCLGGLHLTKLTIGKVIKHLFL